MKADQITLGVDMRKHNVGFRMFLEVTFKISIERFSAVRNIGIVLDVLVPNELLRGLRRLVLVERQVVKVTDELFILFFCALSKTRLGIITTTATIKSLGLSSSLISPR